MGGGGGPIGSVAEAEGEWATVGRADERAVGSIEEREGGRGAGQGGGRSWYVPTFLPVPIPLDADALFSASRLYDSFSALLASRPHLASNSTSSLVPSATTLHAALPTFLASMAREAAYQGTMDPANQRAVRESAMEGKGKDVVMGGY